MRRTRRPALAALVAVLASGSLAACATGPSGGTSTDAVAAAAGQAEPGAFPVTVRHAFGSTTIESEPTRVATLGWSDQDAALALGVVPVGAVKMTWGGNDAGSTPWFDEALAEAGGDQPVRYDDSDGVPFEDLAELGPDLILATNSGLTEADYAKLSRIAPVVAYPEVPWGTSWEDSTEMIGRALGRPAAADALVDRVEDDVETFEDAHPALDDTTFAFATFDLKDTSQIGYYTPLDNRPQLLEELGLDNAAVVERWSQGSQEFWRTVSSERAAELRSDIVVTYAETDADRGRIAADPAFSQVPAVGSGATVYLVDKTDALTMSAPSPLAMPWFLDRIAPSVAEAAGRA